MFLVQITCSHFATCASPHAEQALMKNKLHSLSWKATGDTFHLNSNRHVTPIQKSLKSTVKTARLSAPIQNCNCPCRPIVWVLLGAPKPAQKGMAAAACEAAQHQNGGAGAAPAAVVAVEAALSACCGCTSSSSGTSLLWSMLDAAPRSNLFTLCARTQTQQTHSGYHTAAHTHCWRCLQLPAAHNRVAHRQWAP